MFIVVIMNVEMHTISTAEINDYVYFYVVRGNLNKILPFFFFFFFSLGVC